MIKQAIEKVVNHEDLTFEESQAVLDEIMNGEASEVQTASLLTALTAKRPTIDEIAGAAASMRRHALAFPETKDVLEIVEPVAIMPTPLIFLPPAPLLLRRLERLLPNTVIARLHPRAVPPMYLRLWAWISTKRRLSVIKACRKTI